MQISYLFSYHDEEILINVRGKDVDTKYINKIFTDNVFFVFVFHNKLTKNTIFQVHCGTSISCFIQPRNIISE